MFFLQVFLICLKYTEEHACWNFIGGSLLKRYLQTQWLHNFSMRLKTQTVFDQSSVSTVPNWCSHNLQTNFIQLSFSCPTLKHEQLAFVVLWLLYLVADLMALLTNTMTIASTKLSVIDSWITKNCLHVNPSCPVPHYLIYSLFTS